MTVISFPHGLGDCCNFAAALPLYVKRGHDITVRCNPDKRIVFEGSGVSITHDDLDCPVYAWDDTSSLDELNGSNFARCNKAAYNFSRWPMPDIGRPEDLWDEFIATKPDVLRFVSKETWADVDRFLADLPRPVVLVHTVGNSYQNLKSLPDDVTRDLYRALLDKTDGCLVLLDWDNRAPRMSGYRIRHLTDDWKWIDVPTLLALISCSDLLVGIDSGPYHLARFTNTPTVGVFPTTDMYPVRYTLPRDRGVCVVPRDLTMEWNTKARVQYNIVHCDGDRVTADFIAATARAMLDKPRYLGQDRLGADVQLQQFVLDFERGYACELSGNVDRHRSFDALLQEMGKRFTNPVVVETGCIRCSEDWRGAGYSTYLLGTYVERTGGFLYSVDLSPENCAFACSATAELTRTHVTCSDSVSYLKHFGRPIDVLFVDSMDTTCAGHEDHALREVEAALDNLRYGSLVAFDDTVYEARNWKGKGAKAVPWMLESGWEILYSGYQTVLRRR